MKKILSIVCALLMTSVMFAQEQPSTPWDEANQAYANGNYNDAISAYQAILEENPSSEVYYNLGNAYFKIGEVAHAILCYERCLRLDPTNKDAKFNLKFAQSRIVDNIKDNHTSFLKLWSTALRDCMSERAWFIVSVALFLLALVGIFLFAFMHQMWLRKTSFFGAIFAFIFSLTAMICGLSAHNNTLSHDDAIIMQGIVNVKSSPDKSGTDLFVLHEGTKVTITDLVGEWCEISVGDNKGWIRQSALERI